VNGNSRLGLVRRSPAFGLLFLATAASGFGTYLAAIALTVDIFDRTDSGVWVAALLIADFLPIVVIGLLLGPLVDRLSRRGLMVVSDLVRFGVFAALPFVDSPGAIVALAGVAGVATGFFRPAVYAGLPNLVPDDELTNANSLLQTIETLAWMVGPVVGGLMLTAWSPSVPYGVNAVTFLVSAGLVAMISERRLRSEESLTRGHWRDVADGIRLVLTSAPLRTVLIVWNVVLVGSAAINVAEVVFAKDTLGAGDVGFGVLVAASGVGLALGSFLAAPALGKVGLRRHYAVAILAMGLGWGGAALTTSIWVAVPFVIAGAAGNGAAIISNQILVQRGAPDRYRGRALATIMSSNYAILGVAMAAAGVFTDLYGARAVWMAAGGGYLFGAVVSLVVTRWLPVSAAAEDELLDRHGQEAARALAGEAALAAALPEVVPEPAPVPVPAHVYAPEPVSAPEPAYAPEPTRAPEPAYAPLPAFAPEPASPAPAAVLPEPETEPEPEPEPEPERAREPEAAPEPPSAPVPKPQPALDGSSRGSLERIALLLEEIEERRRLERSRS
jgi:MFS family permease